MEWKKGSLWVDETQIKGKLKAWREKERKSWEIR
jgi:hypothetical protein